VTLKVLPAGIEGMALPPKLSTFGPIDVLQILKQLFAVGNSVVRLERDRARICRLGFVGFLSRAL